MIREYLKYKFKPLPKNHYLELLEDIEVFKVKVSHVMKNGGNRIKRLVDFLDLIAFFQDKNSHKISNAIIELKERDYGNLEIKRKIKALKDFERTIKISGRDLQGMNRTSFGEEVTYNNVYLSLDRKSKACTAYKWLKLDMKNKNYWEISNISERYVINQSLAIVSTVEELRKIL